MPHDTTAKGSEDTRRRGSLDVNVNAIELSVDLVELEMASLPSLLNKVHAKIDMLGTVTATDGVLGPSDACLILGKYRSRCSLRKAQDRQELTEKITS